MPSNYFGTLTGVGDVMVGGNIIFDNDTNAWQGSLRTIGDFPQPIKFTTINNVGEGPSALGNPQNSTQGTITLTGGSPKLEYVGVSNTTDRIIYYSGFGDWDYFIRASGSTTTNSPFKITSNLAGGKTSKYLQLGGTGAGEWAGNLLTANLNNLKKIEAGTWTLSGTNTYAGETVVEAGTLRTTHAAVFPTNGIVKLAGGTLNLDFAGMNMVSALYTNGTQLPNGMYGSNNVAAITGGGALLVGVPLAANFTATPQAGAAPLQVVFADTSVSILGTITNWAWDFGNGVTTNYTNFVAALTNTYALWGTYPVQLTVSDSAGYSTNKTINVTVTQPTNLVVDSASQYATATINVGPQTVAFSNGIVSPSFGGLTGSGSLALTNADADCVTLVVGQDSPDVTFAGALTGCGGLTKVGANTFALAGSNTYSGATTISNGTLRIAMGSGAVNVLSNSFEAPVTGSFSENVTIPGWPLSTGSASPEPASPTSAPAVVRTACKPGSPRGPRRAPIWGRASLFQALTIIRSLSTRSAAAAATTAHPLMSAWMIRC